MSTQPFAAPDRRRLAVAGAGWVTLACLMLLGLSGAAADSGGFMFALPSMLLVATTLALLGLVIHTCGFAYGSLALGFAPVLVLMLAGVPFSGIGALTGGHSVALALAAIAAIVARSRPTPATWLLPLIAFAVYAGVAVRVQAQVGAEGDEPHYLMVADSLLHDHDVSLEADYAEGRYRAFHPAPLEPHYRVRGKHGEIYSIHALGLSLLILPAYAVAGYPGASLFMAMLAAWLACEIRALVRDWSGDATLAEAVSWIVALSPPLVHYAGLVFTEVPAALLVAYALRRARDAEPTRARALAWGLALAFLPWLNVRYAILSILLLAYRASYRTRAWVWLLLPGALSAVAIAGYHHALYGFFDPRRVYGVNREFALSIIPEGLPGLLLDQEFGLLVYAPVFALALPGLGLVRTRWREGVICAAMIGAILATASAWPMWRGGFNPPARFLVPVIPVLAVLVAHALRKGLRAGPALLIGWGIWTGLAAGADPHLVHRDRDGTAPFWRQWSGAEEWTRLLPGYVLSEADRGALALVWTGALAVAIASPGRATAVNLGLASLGLVTAATGAAHVSHQRAGGREEVRVVGRTSLRVPGWTLERSQAHWRPDELDWGPAYEPHRHPEGAVIGARLPLRPGPYRLEIDADVLGDLPFLEVRPEPPGSSLCALERGPSGAAVSFSVSPDAHAVTLALRGGGGMLLRGFSLTSTFPAAPGLIR